MFGVGWSEIVVIGAVALVAIGPKDMPKAMYALGRWAGKARAFAHEMRRIFEQVSYEAQVAEKLKKQKDFPPSEEG